MCILTEGSYKNCICKDENMKNVLIIGAGSSGKILSRELIKNNKEYNVVEYRDWET